MKGTIGAGKTTLSKLIHEKVTNHGGVCIHQGPDQYCKTGIAMYHACEMVNQELRKISTIDNDLIVVIIDTCGERHTTNNVFFDINFTGWKQIEVFPTKLQNYLHWTLRNVLSRSACSKDTDFNINPITTDIRTCVDVHFKKATVLFGKMYVKRCISSYVLNDALQQLKPKADEYNTFLQNTMPLQMQVENIFTKIMNL